ncbi:hypothetical protein BASA81_011138 [Batrachochytrium salamandrivorans]|nr:hypothetical protein BASA81_011138 [Batrachochytrium salamandrivorans]
MPPDLQSDALPNELRRHPGFRINHLNHSVIAPERGAKEVRTPAANRQLMDGPSHHLVSIEGLLGYEPSTLPLRHGELPRPGVEPGPPP